ncbi:dienelactone hydrolase family protein [Hymenobacter sp.]|uniref:dienelactone hydrolase family protein n=1 Tax=Hymenobacter sp. TaxID=1898978 RepID=UPI00286AC1E1|nr:dienelactone hydrolase family protein [Hymenobacter sp.]
MVTADLPAAHAWLQAQALVRADKIGSIDFCLGGRVAFLANAVLPLAAAVSYYGGGTHPLKDRAANPHAQHLLYRGGLNAHIRKEYVIEVTAGVEAAGKPFVNTIISYAGHSFHRDERASHHPPSASCRRGVGTDADLLQGKAGRLGWFLLRSCLSY